ncbi:hypothetical protein EVAR_34461_1 [Eumeta japonica]|uniref:Uncharacterized protein n=1 Tax=Eumeta variegata TaxID=151549 RepID=A0A4C1WXZ9_EUMVA|nr:hypothetical protein EVAR_34461_1 [Eumeta japonica]
MFQPCDLDLEDRVPATRPRMRSQSSPSQTPCTHHPSAERELSRVRGTLRGGPVPQHAVSGTGRAMATDRAFTKNMATIAKCVSSSLNLFRLYVSIEVRKSAVAVPRGARRGTAVSYKNYRNAVFVFKWSV